MQQQGAECTQCCDAASRRHFVGGQLYADSCRRTVAGGPEAGQVKNATSLSEETVQSSNKHGTAKDEQRSESVYVDSPHRSRV